MTIAKTCEKVFRCLRLKVEHVFNNKSESNNFFHSQMKSHIIKQLLSSISVDIRIYLPLKVKFTFSGR